MNLLARAVELLAALAAGVAALAAWTGGWRVDLFGATLSVRDLSRPIGAALLLLAVRLLFLRRGQSVVSDVAAVASRVGAGAILVAALLSWMIYLSPYAGGSDSYAYISAAERLQRGALIEREPLAALLPYDRGIEAASPLGYVPAARVGDASVPAYPLGLPALMALAAVVFGDRAMFYVTPAMSVVALLASAWLARRWFAVNASHALPIAAALALHPVVFTYSIQPMSDMPAAACFLVAAACLSSTHRGGGGGALAMAAGAAAALAFFIRPAIAPALLVLGALPIVAVPRQWPRAALYLALLVAAFAAQAWLHWYLYGDPFTTGYGRSPDLFGLQHAATNARSYAYWGWFVHGPIWVFGLVAAAWRLRLAPAASVMLFAAVTAAVVPYAIYRSYDHWETLRFLLPALIVLSIVALAGLLAASWFLAGVAGPALGLVLILALVAGWVSWLDRQQVFTLARSEERYRLAGEMVDRVTPPDAVVLTSLHSGSLRYYSKRGTLDWNDIPAGQLEPTVRALQRAGLPVFLMFDNDAEKAVFDTRHGRVVEERGWLPNGQRRDMKLYAAPQ